MKELIRSPIRHDAERLVPPNGAAESMEIAKECIKCENRHQGGGILQFANLFVLAHRVGTSEQRDRYDGSPVPPEKMRLSVVLAEFAKLFIASVCINSYSKARVSIETDNHSIQCAACLVAIARGPAAGRLCEGYGHHVLPTNRFGIPERDPDIRAWKSCGDSIP